MARSSARRCRAALLLLAALGGCTGAAIELDGLDGKRHAPQQVAPGEVHAIVFTSHECPVASAYAPTLRSLASGWSGQPVRLFVVFVDPELTAAQARQHGREHDLPGTLLLDPRQRLASALGISRTPEAVVLGPGGLVYRGRIDDQWASVGVRSPAPSTHELRDAVAAALRGARMPLPHPPPVGCLLPEPAR